jgi:NADH:ubiquinone oxidoreductase subunit 6 (subunit J)
MGRPLPPPAETRPARLWLLPLVAGALPLIGTVVAFQLAVAQGQFPACNPLLEGCVSISRAARFDLPNHLFRALLLPAAALQGLVWLLAGAWLARLGAPRDRLLRLLPWIGLTAAAFLVLYGTFLGTEGHGYRLMRRYGVFVYFGFTCISMLIVAGAVHQAGRADGAWRGQLFGSSVALYALTAALPLLGIVHVLSPLVIDSEAARDAFGNVTEWWGGAIFTAFFFLLAWLWRKTRFGAVLRAGDG